MESTLVRRGAALALLCTAVLWTGAPVAVPTPADSQWIGINVVLREGIGSAALEILARHGTVRDVLPQIRAVTLQARPSALAAIQALACVEGANPDRQGRWVGGKALPVPDLAEGDSHWSLDAIDVTDFGIGRTVGYDGEGVYVAVVDTGLAQNWRSYFPEERIATEFARAFTGGGGHPTTVSSQPEKWEHDADGHGTAVTGVLLGFAYSGSDDRVPRYFNGVAPKATVIPVRVAANGSNGHEASIDAQAILYVADLKASGALGDAPVVINASWGLFEPDVVLRAAIDYAIDHGVLFVAGAGNEGSEGMRWPGAYPEVISAGATGWVGALPADQSTTYLWCLGDVPEDDASQHYVGPYSSRALSGQELDVAAPGTWVPIPSTIDGTDDYAFGLGTSFATAHVAGVVALMLQKNRTLSQAEVESILRATAVPLPAASATVGWARVGPGNPPRWGDDDNVVFFDLDVSWEDGDAGAGLLQADAALVATPSP